MENPQSFLVNAIKNGGCSLATLVYYILLLECIIQKKYINLWCKTCAEVRRIDMTMTPPVSRLSHDRVGFADAVEAAAHRPTMVGTKASELLCGQPRAMGWTGGGVGLTLEFGFSCGWSKMVIFGQVWVRCEGGEDVKRDYCMIFWLCWNVIMSHDDVILDDIEMSYNAMRCRDLIWGRLIMFHYVERGWKMTIPMQKQENNWSMPQ